jgi:hypothetical protein
MKQFNNRHSIAIFVVLSAASLAHGVEVVIGNIGHVVIPFCAGVYQGVRTYKSDQRFKLSRLVKDNVVVGVTSTGAFAVQNFPTWYEQNDLAYHTKVETYDNFSCVMLGKLEKSPHFDTANEAQGYLQKMQTTAKANLNAMPTQAAYHFGAQLAAFPTGYAVGYNVMKLCDKKRAATVAPAAKITEKK